MAITYFPNFSRLCNLGRCGGPAVCLLGSNNCPGNGRAGTSWIKDSEGSRAWKMPLISAQADRTGLLLINCHQIVFPEISLSWPRARKRQLNVGFVFSLSAGRISICKRHINVSDKTHVWADMGLQLVHLAQRPVIGGKRYYFCLQLYRENGQNYHTYEFAPQPLSELW